MGTVIDEAAARCFESASNDAVARRRTLLVRQRARAARCTRRPCSTASRPEMTRGASRRPSARSRRSSASQTIDEAIRIANCTAYGLSSAVCTNRLDYITRFVTELNVGSVNVREVPGLPAGADAVRRHQGLRARLQGRRAGSDEELHQHQDLLAAVADLAAAARDSPPRRPAVRCASLNAARSHCSSWLRGLLLLPLEPLGGHAADHRGARPPRDQPRCGEGGHRPDGLGGAYSPTRWASASSPASATTGAASATCSSPPAAPRSLR